MHNDSWAVLDDEQLCGRASTLIARAADRLSDPHHVRSAQHLASAKQGVPMGDLRSLASGYLSLVVLYAELHRGAPEAGWLEVASQYFRLAADQARAQPLTTPGLFCGSAGYVYALATLREFGLDLADALDSAATGAATQLDLLLRRGVEVPLYDLITGAVGIAVALHTAAQAGSPSADERLPEVLDIIQHRMTTDLEIAPYTGSAAGLSVGLPALLGLLTVSPTFSPLQPERASLIDAQLRRAWRPSIADRGGWCIGQSGTAFVLLSRQARQDPGDRATLLETFSGDAELPRSKGLCHGVAGLLAMAMRLHNRSDVPIVSHFASRCLEDLIGAADIGLPFVYLDRRGPARLHDPGLLMGTAGILLALLSATVAVEPRWDRCMLLRL